MKTPDTWKVNLAALSTSQFLYRAGTRSLIPFLPFFIHDLGKTNFEDTALWSGWIFAIPFIVSFFTTPLWGSFGDKFGRKLITMLAILGFSVSQFLMGTSANLTQLLLFAALQEAINTESDCKAGVFGVGSSFQTAGNLLGSAFSGVIVASLGVSAPFVAAGLVFLFAIPISKLGLKMERA